MNRPTKAASLLKLSASSLVFVTLLAGCKPSTLTERPRSPGNASIVERLASKLAEQAARAAAMGDQAQAVDLAERAVAGAPNDAGYRTFLAQSYLRAGRFVSADQAFADVIRLMPDNDKARVGQAVARIAQGNRAGALEILSEVRNAPADDIGLALALAGDTRRAIMVLEPVARGMRGTSRTRQNLALAYALDGQWAKARTVAAQDVSPTDIDRRMESWAKLASPESREMQVASLIGATPVAGDPGQPMMLALVKEPVTVEAAPVAVAAAEPEIAEPVPAASPATVEMASAPVAVPVAVETETAENTSASAEQMPVAEPAIAAASSPAESGADEVAAAVAPAPVAQADPVEVSTAAPARLAATKEADIQPVAVPASTVAAAAPIVPEPAVVRHDDAVEMTSTSRTAPFTGVQLAPVAVKTSKLSFEQAPLGKKIEPKGEWVVQLGAYKNPRWMESGWLYLSDNFKRLAQYTPVHSTYTVSASGAVFYRLSVIGFADRASAATLCSSIKLKGGDCFVRRARSEAPMQMVSRRAQQLAANY